MSKSQRLTDDTGWRKFMRLLRLDDMMTSYTNARRSRGGSLLCAQALVDRSFDVGQRLSSRLQLRCRVRITGHTENDRA